MKMSMMAGLALIVLGIVLLATGFSYTRKRDVVRVGSMEVTAEEKRAIPPYAGAIAIVAGVALVVMGRRRA